MKILIICSNLIGDTILSTGVIKHFVDQYKDAKISLVIGPTAAPIFRNYKNIDEVIIFKKRKFNFHWIDILKKTYKIKWDIVVDFRSSALSYLLKNKKKYIFKKWTGRPVHILGCRFHSELVPRLFQELLPLWDFRMRFSKKTQRMMLDPEIQDLGSWFPSLPLSFLDLLLK